MRFCTIFRIFGPLAPPAGRNWEREHRNRGPGTTNPLGGGEKNYAPGGEPGRAQHSAGTGDGLAPPSQGRSAAQRQRGGTRCAGGETGARGQQTGDRAAQRRGRPADEAGPRRGGTPCPRKRAALAPAGRLPQMPRAAVPHGASGWGLWPPPERGTSRAKRCNAAPRRGGPAPTRPHVAGLHGRSKQRTGPRPQVADGGTALGLVDERCSIGIADV